MSLAQAASGADPAPGLRAAQELRELAERLEALQVRNARDARLVLAGDRRLPRNQPQAVHKKYATRRQPRPAGTGDPMFEKFASRRAK